MALDTELIALLRCPVTMQPVRLATAEELRELNARMGDAPLESALVREDRLAFFPVKNGIPIMLPDAIIS